MCLKTLGSGKNEFIVRTYVVINEAFLLLNISNGGTDGNVMWELVKVTKKKNVYVVKTVNKCFFFSFL